MVASENMMVQAPILEKILEDIAEAKGWRGPKFILNKPPGIHEIFLLEVVQGELLTPNSTIIRSSLEPSYIPKI